MGKLWRLSVLGLTLLLLTLALASRSVVFAQSNANPEKIVSLVGTTWSGTDSDGDYYVFTFQHEGTLAYQSPSGSFRNGKWNQFNNAVYFEMNDHVSEYLGAISGDSIEGKAWNKQRRIWVWKVSRNK